GVGVGRHNPTFVHAGEPVSSVIAVCFHPVARQVAVAIVSIGDVLWVSAQAVSIHVQEDDLGLSVNQTNYFLSNYLLIQLRSTVV
ncbi:MAG: hypothetical protein IBX69_17015, partial [Anaerolineales bacterium]|nr:hypothetical protein [Anaerolineales bacterium]